MAQTGVIIVAGGAGNRMGEALPKQFLLLHGSPVLAHTINNFATALPGAEIIVVLPTAYLAFWKNFAARFEIASHKVTEGGAERFHSVQNGISALDPATEIIAVQDAVRPLGSVELIRRTHAAAERHGAAIPVVEPVDSLRQIQNETSRPIDRRTLRMVQTPQIFRAEILRQAYAAEFCATFTDDASVVEQTGQHIFLCEGERQNMKITTREDLTLVAALLAAREELLDNACEDEGEGEDKQLGTAEPTKAHCGCNKHGDCEKRCCGDGNCEELNGSCDGGCGCEKRDTCGSCDKSCCHNKVDHKTDDPASPTTTDYTHSANSYY